MRIRARFGLILLLVSPAFAAEATRDAPRESPEPALRKASSGKSAQEKKAPPAKTRVKPLSLELELLKTLAKSRKRGSEEAKKLAEKAAYLERTAGAGYALGVAHPERRPEDEHALAIERALRILVDMPLREASYLLDALYRGEKIRIPIPADAEGKPALKLKACLSGLQAEIAARKKRIEELRSGARISVRGLARGIDTSPKARIEELERAVERLGAYERRFQELMEELERSEELKRDLEKLADPQSRRFQAAELSRLVERFGASTERVAGAEGVGTHQVRIRVEPAVRGEIEAELDRRIEVAKREGKGKTLFLKTDLSFLPRYWPDSAEGRPRGDFRITEYLSGGEVFLTVFDCVGVFYRLVVFERKGTLCAIIPSGPLDSRARGVPLAPERVQGGV